MRHKVFHARLARPTAVLLSIAVSFTTLSPSPARATGSTTFYYTGGSQDYVVPSGVYQVLIDAWGARGGGTSLGWGGHSRGRFSVTPGETLKVYAGGIGTVNPPSGGWNGGGRGGPNAGPQGGGGGASDVRQSGNALANRIIVGGGGGGAGAADILAANGGSGGGLNGGNGDDPGEGGLGGGGGTQVAGGNGGISMSFSGGLSPPLGNYGVLGQGGDATQSVGRGGGGGGGYYGGGGGAGAEFFGSYLGSGGGGGSGFVSTATPDTQLENGMWGWYGQVIIAPASSSLADRELASPAAFECTHNPEDWFVPPGVTSITVDARGAQGSGGSGGYGGRAQATLPVSPGQQLTITVGCRDGYGGGGGGGGYSGYGYGGYFAGNGGGGSQVVTGGGIAVVAGGGGGQGSTPIGLNGAAGGAGGGTSGSAGSGSSGSGGGGGTQSSGGALGTRPSWGIGGSAGWYGHGGGGSHDCDWACYNFYGGGGGGGGYYGGGGGGNIPDPSNVGGGGGGGSSYIGVGTNTSTTSGFQAGDGRIIISYYASISPTPVGYWKFDEGIGTTALDTSGNGNNATLVNGPSWQPHTSCTSLGCVGLDGVDDYLNAPHSPSLSMPQFTVSAWVYPQGVKSDWQPLVTKQASGGGSRNYGLFIVPNTSVVHYSFQGSDCSTWYSYNSVGSLVMHQWNHVAMAYNGVSFNLYIDGVLDSSHSVSVQPCLNSEPVKIGRELSAYTPYQGRIDEVSIYRLGLSATEVQGLYAASGLGSPVYAESDKVGLEDFYPYRNFDLGSDSGYLNLATGNLVVQATDIAAPGVGLSMRLNRTYNLVKDSIDGPLGRGWSLGVADGEGPLGELISAINSVDVIRVAKTAANPDSFDFYDADGTRHHFVKPLGQTVWQSPPGVNLYMTDYFVGLDRHYKATRPDGVVYDFAPDSLLGTYHLASISDRRGNALTFGYTGSQLTSITDPSSRVMTLTWSGGRITGASYAGLSSSYTYSGDRLTSVSAGGRLTSYAYNTSGMSSATDARSSTTNFSVTGGMLNSLTDRAGKVWSLIYNNPTSCQPSSSDAAGATCVTDPEANTEVYTYSRYSNLLSYKDAGDETSSGTRKNLRSYAWAANRLANAVSEDGATTSYAYNQWGQVASETKSGAGEESFSTTLVYKDVLDRIGATDLVQIVEGAGSSDQRAYNLSYDIQGNLTSVINPEARTTSFTYLSGGRLASTTDPRGKTTSFSSYHASGRPQTVTDPLGHSTTYAYNVFGKPTSITDRNSNSWSFGYDGRANMTSATTPNGSASWGFDSNDNLTSDSPLGGPTTAIVYDSRDLATSSTTASRTTSYTYYDDGQLKESIAPMGASQKTTYQRFPNNRVMATIDPEGAQTDFTYTPAGLQKTVIYPPNSSLGTRHATVTTYNRRGQTTSVLESGHSNPTTYTYNPFGELTSTKTPKGSTTANAYDKMGRVLKTTDAAGRNTTRAYDAAGNLIALVQPTGSNLSVATQYTYTDRNEMASETDPADMNHLIQYSYDNEGHQRYRYDKYSGTTERTIEQIFRGDGMMTEKIATATGMPTYRATFTYDGGGKPIASTSYLDGNTVSSISASYNSAQELSSTTETIYPPGASSVAKTVSYGYQSDGLLSSRTVDGSATNYEHFLAGTEKKTIPWGGMGEFVSTHNPNGSLASQTLPNGSVLTQTYDLADRILSKTVKNTAGDRLSSWEAVAYDEGDNRLSEAVIQKQIAGSVPEVLAGNSQYGYDSADRQISYKHPIEPDATHYGLDDAGNVVSDKDATYNYLNNRLVSRTPNDPEIAGGPFTYSYDHFGNQTTSTQLVPAPQTTTTTYDGASQTKRVTSPDGSWVEYGYDGFERMAYRKEHPTSGSDVVTLFFHDGTKDQIVLETDGSGTIKTRYILDSTGDPVGKEDIGNSTGRSYYVDDLRGNLVQMLDGSQNVVATFAFDAYGEKKPFATKHSGNWDSRLKFQMAPEDPKTGNYNLGPRIFAPKLTRFTSSDYYADAFKNLSLQLDPLTNNKFVYASANPSSLIDDGHGPRCGKWCKRLARLAKRNFKCGGNPVCVASYYGNVTISGCAAVCVNMAMSNADGRRRIGAGISWVSTPGFSAMWSPGQISKTVGPAGSLCYYGCFGVSRDALTRRWTPSIGVGFGLGRFGGFKGGAGGAGGLWVHDMGPSE